MIGILWATVSWAGFQEPGGNKRGAPQDVRLSFNNTTTAVRTADGPVVLLYIDRSDPREGKLVWNATRIP